MTETVAPETTGPPITDPTMAGTFAVYLLDDGTAGLVLDIQRSAEGATGITRHHVPQFVVDMVLYGKRPSPATLLKMMRGNGNAEPEREAGEGERSPEAGDGTEILDHDPS